MKAVKGTINEALKQVANHEVEENYNRDLTLATKNVARLSNKEKGQDKKDYQAVSRALAQGNLGAVKKVIKGISTKEIQADLLNILVGYNALIAKMYPKAMVGGKFKTGMTVDKIIKEEAIVEAKDTHCSDKCCGSNVTAEDCKCPPDCDHCNCNEEQINERETDKYGNPKLSDADKDKIGKLRGQIAEKQKEMDRLKIQVAMIKKAAGLPL